MEHLGEDAHGVWLRAPAGTPVQRGSEEPIAIAHPFVKVVTRGRWWTGLWNGGSWSDGRSIHTYVDVVTPAAWEDGTVRMVDLDLDVVRYRDGVVEIDDEDEFDEHRVAMSYPEHIVDKARAEAARLKRDVERGVEPFGFVGERWLEAARGH